MSMRLGDIAPDFQCRTTQGPIRFHEWIGSGWAILFSHPKDFTPVCTTELGYVARLMPEFDRRNCKVIGLSIDSVDDHLAWIRDIEQTQQVVLNYPLIGDDQLEVAKLYGMIHPNVNGSARERTALDNATVRSVFIIGPDKTVKLMITYPMSTGRNFDEVLRVLESLQLTAVHQVATPVNWSSGEDVIIAPSVPDAVARERYPDGWEAPRPYLRFVPHPGS